jgi:hypothetical protein
MRKRITATLDAVDMVSTAQNLVRTKTGFSCYPINDGKGWVIEVDLSDGQTLMEQLVVTF